MLLPISTPLKNAIKMEAEPEDLSTVRRNIHIFNTPGSESRASERGLKRLAAEAYRFVVSNQKRTSYK
jgi:hypothetical protein